jgi:hypothetical protein
MQNLLSRARRKIRLIEGDEKCRHLKKLTCKKDFAAGFNLSEAQNLPPPLDTVYVYTVYLFTQGSGGEGESWTREKVRGKSSLSWVENTNMTGCISSL